MSDLNRHLRVFLYLNKQQPIDVVSKSAIYLLQNLPSSRHSVLEYFGTLFELATVFHVNKSNTNADDVNNLNEVIDEIQHVLLTLIKNEAWSLELFDWSLELIALLSNKYENSVVKQSASSQQLSIIDALHNWIQCKAIKSALEIAQNCITETKNKVEIIERLLSIHSKYASNADWIVCHLGSLCANETILYIFVLGFKEFLAQQQSALRSPINILKFNSIVVILNYFTNLYSQFIRNLLMKMFQSFLKGDYEYFKNNFPFNSDQIKQYILLYLIQLGLLSPNMFYIMSSGAKETLNPFAIESLYHQSTQIFNFETRNSLFTNLKLLLRQLSNDSYEFLNYLIDLALNGPLSDEIKKAIKSFIESFLDDLNSFVLTNTKEPIAIIDSLRKDFKTILNELLLNANMNEHRKNWLLSLITLIGIQGPSYLTNSIMARMLTTKHYDINNLFKYRQEIDLFDLNSLSYTIDAIIKTLKSNKNCYSNEQRFVNDQIGIDLSLNEACLDTFLSNLVELHEWDLKNEHSGYNIDIILQKADCFIDLVCLIDTDQSTIVKLFNKIGLPDKLEVDQCLKFSFYLIKYFFRVIESETDKIKQVTEIDNIKQMIQTACLKYNETLRYILLRTLVDYFFDETKFYNFQSLSTTKKLSDRNNNSQKSSFQLNDDSSGDYVSLYEQNLTLRKHLPTTKLRAKVPLVDNLDRNRNKFAEKLEQLSLLNYEFMEIVEIICSVASTSKGSSSNNQIINTNQSYNNDLLNSLAQLTIERFNPSYIDYQWPDIENFKLYIERDVKVQNMVEESPVCWMLLYFIANNQAIFCKCIPTIRSLLASLILQWENVKEQPAKNSAKLLELTMKFLNLINKAQLLSPPLSYTIDIIPLVSSYEVHVILTIIWKYLKTILGSLSQTTTKVTQIQHKALDKPTVDQLKIIFQRNINKLAHFYAKFFKDLVIAPPAEITIAD